MIYTCCQRRFSALHLVRLLLVLIFEGVRHLNPLWTPLNYQNSPIVRVSVRVRNEAPPDCARPRVLHSPRSDARECRLGLVHIGPKMFVHAAQ